MSDFLCWLRRALIPCLLVSGACVESPLVPGPGSEPGSEIDEAGFLAWRDTLPPGPRPDTFIVEGDIVLGADEVREYYGFYAEGRPTDLWLVQPYTTSDTSYSIVRLDGTHDDLNTPERKIDLTYCVSDEFNAGHLRLKNLLVQATNDWERHAHINFAYLSEFDGECERNELGVDDVYFTVERIGAGSGILGRAFFPSYLPADRYMLISDEAMDLGDADLLGVLRHELGHILGLRHEHIANPIDCGFDSFTDARQLTPLDTASVMFYDFCPNAAGPNNEITRYDALGVRYLYNLPKHGRRGEVSIGGFTSMYTQYTDYDSDGRTDVFWWNSVSAALKSIYAGQPGPAFASSAFLFDSGRRHKPFAERFSDSGALSTDLFRYGVGTIPDALFTTAGIPPVFSFRDVNIDDKAVPVVGDYDNNGYADVIWYRPGEIKHAVWSFTANAMSTWEVELRGHFLPIPGDFTGDRCDDIVWYNPGGAKSVLWRASCPGGFVGESIDNATYGLAVAGTPYIPIPGDFNGDEKQDIFWYRAGTASDRLWIAGGGSPAALNVGRTVDGFYRPISARFNNDATSDILWYDPNPGVDRLWHFYGTGTHVERQLSIEGDYAPFAGDFDGDNDADILWYRPYDAWSPLWRAHATGFTPLGDIITVAASYPLGYGPVL